MGVVRAVREGFETCLFALTRARLSPSPPLGRSDPVVTRNEHVAAALINIYPPTTDGGGGISAFGSFASGGEMYLSVIFGASRFVVGKIQRPYRMKEESMKV